MINVTTIGPVTTVANFGSIASIILDLLCALMSSYLQSVNRSSGKEAKVNKTDVILLECINTSQHS